MNNFAEDVVGPREAGVGLPVAAEEEAEGAGAGLQGSDGEDEEAQVVVGRARSNVLAPFVAIGEREHGARDLGGAAASVSEGVPLPLSRPRPAPARTMMVSVKSCTSP